VNTGEVLDYHVLSETCQKCAVKKRNGLSDGEFEEWLMEHEGGINFAGSSPTMSEGAVVLWEKSVERHIPWYRWMASNGESRAFIFVENAYGKIKVEKLDCVGHV